jgi:HEAT repeat protein
VALYALAEIDPGEDLEKLLDALANTLDVPPPQPPAPSPFPFPPPALEPVIVGIPFERLEAVIRGPHHRLRASAVKLIGYVDNEQLFPLLIDQLDSRIPRVREMALMHLRRLSADCAADAVARLMNRDFAFQRRAAEALLTWNDARCVPLLLQIMQNDETVKNVDIIKKLGKLDHAVLTDWLTKVIDELEPQGPEAIAEIIEIMAALVEVKSPQLEPILNRLAKSSVIKIREMTALALGEIKAEWAQWAQPAAKAIIADRTPEVAYRAAQSIHDASFGSQLLEQRNKAKRLLGVRILWSARDTEALIACLQDESPAVKSMAAWGLTQSLLPISIDALWRLVEEEDRINMWGLNLAVMAWTALAKMNQIKVTNVAPELPVVAVS